jgi:uncharacterized protein YbgA (DUF1722 family)/uncharacterized protein YbbK (DUF523 family)
MNTGTETKIPVATSGCLLGEEVRYDSGHKHDRYLTQTLGQFFEFHSFCPEMAIGLGTPREPIRLVATPDGISVRGSSTPDADHTAAMRAYGEQAAIRLEELGVCGYIFKKGSPSCGLFRVKVYHGDIPRPDGRGIFADEITRRLPLIPCEEEGRLCDPVLRDNFVERVFVCHRWRRFLADSPTPGRLVEFHTRHKFILLAHDEPVYRRLGRMVASTGRADFPQLCQEYISDLMIALQRPATRKQHTNVLEHIAGHFKAALDSEDKLELGELIRAYNTGLVPLIVPITLLKHYLRRFPSEYIARQYYIDPHPAELMLRNRI